MLNFYIYEILRKYTDFDHRLTQQEIIDRIKNEYGILCERKAVARNVLFLIEYGIDIANDRGYYLVEREFNDSELRLLIDSLLFTKHIPYSQLIKIIEKLKGLSNEFFKIKVRHVRNLPENKPENKQYFYTIEIIDEAIGAEKQIEFTYNNWGFDKKLHPRREEKYIVNPYQIFATNGKYYLLCNYDKYDNVSYYRLDRITDIKILETKTKEKRLVKGIENGLNLPEHMIEHIYMFSGEAVRVKFKTSNNIISEIIDWFGNGATFSGITESDCIVSVKVNEQAMIFWAMQYGEYVEVLEPKSLRERIKENINSMNKKYKD